MLCTRDALAQPPACCWRLRSRHRPCSRTASCRWNCSKWTRPSSWARRPGILWQVRGRLDADDAYHAHVAAAPRTHVVGALQRPLSSFLPPLTRRCGWCIRNHGQPAPGHGASAAAAVCDRGRWRAPQHHQRAALDAGQGGHHVTLEGAHISAALRVAPVGAAVPSGSYLHADVGRGVAAG